jgi:signal transduction histidine kinase
MTEITATMRQLLAQVGVSKPADLTSEQAANPHNQLLALVNDLLKEALAEAARAERGLRRRLDDLDRALHAATNLLDQGQAPTGLPAHYARGSEPERFRPAAAVDMVAMLVPLRQRLAAAPQPTTDTQHEEHEHE